MDCNWFQVTAEDLPTPGQVAAILSLSLYGNSSPVWPELPYPIIEQTLLKKKNVNSDFKYWLFFFLKTQEVKFGLFIVISNLL